MWLHKAQNNTNILIHSNIEKSQDRRFRFDTFFTQDFIHSIQQLPNKDRA